MGSIFDRWGLAVACAVGLAVFALRLAIHRRRAGTWAITFLRRQGASPLEGTLAAFWILLVLSTPAWVAVYTWSGPEALGVVSLGPAARALGWACLVGGGVLIAVAQAQMGVSWRVGLEDAKTSLVTSGSFALVRNPIYAGMCLAFAGGVLVAPTLLGAGLCVLVALGVALQARIEERHLLALHGEAYRLYADRVGRFVPGVGRLSSGAR